MLANIVRFYFIHSVPPIVNKMSQRPMVSASRRIALYYK